MHMPSTCRIIHPLQDGRHHLAPTAAPAPAAARVAELAEVDTLPCAEHELALGDGQSDRVAEKRGFQVGDRVADASVSDQWRGHDRRATVSSDTLPSTTGRVRGRTYSGPSSVCSQGNDSGTIRSILLYQLTRNLSD